MKKRLIALTLSVLMFCTMSFSVFAAVNGGSCNGNCGPWITSCGGSSDSITRTHTFDYKGYTKTCTYEYVIAITNRICEYCESPPDPDAYVWTHSHGYRNHAAECGWINGDANTCYLN